MTQDRLAQVPLGAEHVRGAVELKQTADGLLPHRLDARARAQNTDGQLAMAESQPSGVRLSLRTSARHLELDVLPTKRRYPGMPVRPDGVYDVVVDGRPTERLTAPGGSTLTVDPATGASEHVRGTPVTLRLANLPDGVKDVEVWLPHDETTELVALRADGETAPLPASDRRTWVHHGSSISQGSGAASPSTTWPALAAAAGGLDLVNLGFGGSALLDPFIARLLRDLPADLVSVEIGINLVNQDLMRLRAFGPAVHGLLDTIRDGHPTTDLVVITPILCPMHETTPGPTAFDMAGLADGVLRFRATGDPADTAQGRLTLQTVRAELQRIVRQRQAQDPHLRLVDGLQLYGAQDAAVRPLPDGLHPDAATHESMGERFASLALSPPTTAGV